MSAGAKRSRSRFLRLFKRPSLHRFPLVPNPRPSPNRRPLLVDLPRQSLIVIHREWPIGIAAWRRAVAQAYPGSKLFNEVCAVEKACGAMGAGGNNRVYEHIVAEDTYNYTVQVSYDDTPA
ncbi:hypothetical protein BT96DRAFT_1001463 [Gymnopus androsaceus JB14]|uniref:Uncharacterized protein n=1 Tax=Gymnopus androsaceus JB14 TaxID=1447944 RepID=A0A6A4H279_9AGAR|nr:hypothetical protein BT96DRAFT_1001463 [Gymnopus androsaceus JB14]